MATYQKLQEIGRGGFGVVELVLDENGKRWALKTLDTGAQPGIDPADLRARFEREVRYQRQMDHPNVVRVHDYDLNSNPPWFVMELADCSLADEINQDRTLGGDPRKPLFDLLAGLEAMHERGFKHRDLKPANVLKIATPQGDDRYAISDFGLMAPEAGKTTTLTASNMGGGTPLYRPPECAINFKRATVQSDIYSVGAILHDIFGGGQPRVPHTELSPPGDLGPIIQKCTKTNPRRRYASVPELREALYEVLNQETITFTSAEEEELVELLQSTEALSEGEWDRVFNQIDDNEAAGRSNHALFRVLTLAHLEQLAAETPELFASLGGDYARYTQKGTFDFDYCDVIANRAQLFYDRGELDLKACIAVALLELGTSHNRWFVERMFMRMASPEISDTLAERMKIEIEVQNMDLNARFKHLGWSISVSPSDLHPILRAMLQSG